MLRHAKIITHAAHIAALLGAHIIKVKPPSSHIELSSSKSIYENSKIKLGDLSNRISHIKESALNGKRLVVFSGGSAKTEKDLYKEIRQVSLGGGDGSIIGRNTFQRPRDEAMKLLENIINIYKGKS